MPRRSRAALSVVAPHPTRSSPLLEPPGELGPRESKLFKDIVGSTDPKHFIKTDALVLARYCEALVLAGDAAKEIRDGGMIVDGRANPAIAIQEKAIRSVATLATRLRLSPQSRMNTSAAGRQAAGPQPSVYDMMRLNDD